MINSTCVIFAGGRSSRMGRDKALLPFAGYETLTEFQYARLTKIFKNVYISCKDSSKFHFDAPFIHDNLDATLSAPTLGFIAVFEKIQCDSFFAISVDAPFIDTETIYALYNKDKKINDATIAKTEDGMQPLCGIYHRSLKEKFKEMLLQDNHRLGYLLKNAKTDFITFEDRSIFLNLNHPHEYQAALQRISTDY